MPMMSKAQNAAMHAAEAGHSTLGIPQSVGAKFVADSHGQNVKGLPKRVGGGSNHMDRLTLASAKHLHSQGRISTGHHDRIVRTVKGEKSARMFGSMAPR